MDDQDRRTFTSGAQRSTHGDDKRFDLISPLAVSAYAAAAAEGSKKYGDYNHLKGIPCSNLYSHLQEHLQKFIMGDKTEDHLGHAMWNLGTLIHFMQTRPELQDIRFGQTAEKREERTKRERLERDMLDRQQDATEGWTVTSGQAAVSPELAAAPKVDVPGGTVQSVIYKREEHKQQAPRDLAAAVVAIQDCPPPMTLRGQSERMQKLEDQMAACCNQVLKTAESQIKLCESVEGLKTVIQSVVGTIEVISNTVGRIIKRLPAELDRTSSDKSDRMEFIPSKAPDGYRPEDRFIDPDSWGKGDAAKELVKQAQELNMGYEAPLG